MQSYGGSGLARGLTFTLALVLGDCAAQRLENAFQESRGRVGGEAGSRFRAMPGAESLLHARLLGDAADNLLAIEHLQLWPAASVRARHDLLARAAAGGTEGVHTAIAIGNVVPWWPAADRPELKRVLVALAKRPRGMFDVQGLARSASRADLTATTELGAIEAMLRSGDAFAVEFGLHQLEGLGSAGKPLLGLLRTLAARPHWPVAPTVDGRPREIACTADATKLVRDRLYWALQRIEPADEAALPFYLERMAKAPPWQQLEFVRCFGCMGTSAVPALPAVLASTRHEWPVLAREAVTVLGMIGVAERSAVERLRALAAAGDPQLRARARASLRLLGVAE